MGYGLSVAIMLVASGGAVAATPPNGPEAAVRTLLSGWYEADAAKAASVLAPDFRLVTLRASPAGPAVEPQTRASLVDAMQKLRLHGWDVRLGTTRVQTDPTGIATLWAPYTFYIDGKKSHCGVETYQLYKLSAGWQIVNFADTHLWNGEEAQCVDRKR